MTASPGHVQPPASSTPVTHGTATILETEFKTRDVPGTPLSLCHPSQSVCLRFRRDFCRTRPRGTAVRPPAVCPWWQSGKVSQIWAGGRVCLNTQPPRQATRPLPQGEGDGLVATGPHWTPTAGLSS